jgi:drug/metabolite transporter (DMT)-like permease
LSNTAETKPFVSPPRTAIARCVLWMSGALFSFTAMAVAARELSHDMGTFQMLVVRSGFGVVLVTLLLAKSGFAQLRLTHLKLHATRNLIHFCGQLGWFYAIGLIPLATVFAIEFTTPLWTAVFAAIFLRERLTASRVAAVVLGIAGILLILRPGHAIIEPAALAMLASALAFGLTHVVTKKLSSRDSALCILFWMSFMQFTFALPPALARWAPLMPAQWPWVAVLGITGISAHYCMVRALSHADATLVVPMDFLRLPLIGLLGFVFYDEQLDWFLAAGALLILAGNTVNLLREHARVTTLAG